MSRLYNHWVKNKAFQLGDLVWKTHFAIWKEIENVWKWSSSWEGQYHIIRTYSGNAYGLVNVSSGAEIKSTNEKYLKVYKLSMHKVKIPT